MEEELQVPRGVAELRVAGPFELGRLDADPGRLEPERVRVREGPSGQEGGAEEDERQREVEQGRAQMRAPAQTRDQGPAPRSRRRRRPATATAATARRPRQDTIQPIRQLSGS